MLGDLDPYGTKMNVVALWIYDAKEFKEHLFSDVVRLVELFVIFLIGNEICI